MSRFLRQLTTPALRQRRRKRQGVAATEFAVCLPMLVLVLVATIDATAMMYLKQSLTIAAYEACRVSLAPGAQRANVAYQAELILQARGVNGGSVTVTPTDFSSTPAGEWITVRTTAPFRQNSLTGGMFLPNPNLFAEVAMIKER